MGFLIIIVSAFALVVFIHLVGICFLAKDRK